MADHDTHDHTGVPGVGATVAADTIWNAKGDLAGGTGSDTAARLGVGANDSILMADSGETTGLKWVASQTPSTQAFSDAAAQGTADTYARGDHKHGMMASPGGTAPNDYESYLSTDVTCVNAFGTSIYSHASLAITPAAGDYEITMEVSVTSATGSPGAAIGILATGGSLASNVLTGHTVIRDTLQYNSASNGGGTIKCIVSARMTLNGSTAVRAAIGAGVGSSDAVIKTTNAQGGATAAANKASRIWATAITPL